MSTNGLIYGSLVINQRLSPGPVPNSALMDLNFNGSAGTGANLGLDIPFQDLLNSERGNHLRDFDPEQQHAFDFWHGHTGAESSKLFVSTRGISITGYRVGEPSETNLTHSLVQNLLAINAGNTELEQQLPYLELAYQKVFSRLSGVRSFVSFEVSSSQSKFILMASHVPVWMWVVADDYCSYLVWTNEASLEDRIRAAYPDRFYYYRFRPLNNSVTVIQSFFLRKKLQKWGAKFKDNLKVLNALEQYLTKRTASMEL